MNATSILAPRDGELIQHGPAPHLSYSRVNRYLTCPEQYRLYYLEGLRPKIPPASLLFGQNVHQALAQYFQSRTDPVAFFEQAWGEARQMELRYSHRETWENLAERGKLLIEKFLIEAVPRLGSIAASEKAFELAVTELDLPFVGVIDLVAEFDGKRTVVDFKTASSAYEDHEVELSDQLTAYQLADPEAEQLALCVLVKTKEPRIEWHLSRRSGEQLMEFLRKVGLIGRDIASGRFYKRPGKHCAWCDFLPVCLGDQARTRETLIRIT